MCGHLNNSKNYNERKDIGEIIMKKICINKIATCIFSLTLFLGSISVVGAIVYRDAIDTYKYDQNIYTEVTSNFGEYTYVKIPEPSRLTN